MDISLIMMIRDKKAIKLKPINRTERSLRGGMAGVGLNWNKARINWNKARINWNKARINWNKTRINWNKTRPNRNKSK